MDNDIYVYTINFFWGGEVGGGKYLVRSLG